MEQYADGDCLLLAFALHWMCGWPVLAVSEKDGNSHLHFAARGPDGMAWDAYGPRSFKTSGEDYAKSPAWEEVDAYRFITTQNNADEDTITQACMDAHVIFGTTLDQHVKQHPA